MLQTLARFASGNLPRPPSRRDRAGRLRADVRSRGRHRHDGRLDGINLGLALQMQAVGIFVEAMVGMRIVRVVSFVVGHDKMVMD